MKSLFEQFLVLVVLFLLPLAVQAQTVKGKILDNRFHPIPEAYIFFHLTEQHAHSDVNGRFEIEGVSTGDTLLVSHIGFEGKTIVVGDVSQELVILLNDRVVELTGMTVTPDLDAINMITAIDLRTAPVNSSQEVLRKVPGLIIGQHAGGGKAEQLFLRGFDIDHGTDINITVDGMPVNLVSHAHGQGYADLHWLIPETIDKIDFGKGPYNAEQGNFATAGYVAFSTKDRIEKSKVQLKYGSFNTRSVLTMLNIVNDDKRSAYVASNYQLSDGPFDSPQHFSRLNIMAKYTARLKNDDKISLLVSTFRSQWDASGQIPERLVKSGAIGRFGAVDDTEGGLTGRTNVGFKHQKNLRNEAYVRSNVYYSLYDFELYSNFTFFLEDSLNGDQIKQKEKREIFGASSEWNKSIHTEGIDILLKAGAGVRNDRVDNVELSHTKNRVTTLERIQQGDVDETNLYSYLHGEFVLGKWLINPAVRFDAFTFEYNDATDTLYNTKAVQKGIVSPKFNILFNQSQNLQWYVKAGSGFHSNDTRVVVKTDGRKVLPAAYGADLGMIWKAGKKLLINTALWALHSQQEFVYVGDAGIVEPSGRSQRSGVDFGVRYQVARPLFAYADVNYSRPRSIDEPEGNDRIALAPELTATGGLGLVDFKNFSAGIQFRFIGDRPANEDNSIVAKGYFITDLNASYTWKSLNFGFAIENLLNSEWKETQFATESRLRNETEPVEEIHFTPGTPFAARGQITYSFQ